MPDINEILAEREKTHGDFTMHALITQNLKHTMRACPNWEMLSLIKKEALDMAAHKIGRILAGNSDHVDHWDDLAGYATLVANYLRTRK